MDLIVDVRAFVALEPRGRRPGNVDESGNDDRGTVCGGDIY